jgi:hypothetical protein
MEAKTNREEGKTMRSTKQETTHDVRRGATLRTGWWRRFGILCLIVAATAIVSSAQDKQPSTDRSATIITFDVPGAGTGLYQGTVPNAISPPGTITGFYIDANYLDGNHRRASVARQQRSS